MPRGWLSGVVIAVGVLLAVAARGETPLEEAGRLTRQAVELFQAGRYQEALPLQEQALKILEDHLGGGHPDTAPAINNLAEIHRALGAYDQALPLYHRALAIREKALGPEHPAVANSLNNLAGLYRSLGAYDQALPLYRRALAIREQALGPEHPDTAVSLNNLAVLYRDLSAYDKALPLFQRALKIREQVRGPEHIDTATGLNNLAGLYEDLGDYAKALPLYIRALKIREQALGPEHPGTATSLNNLAELYGAMGLPEKALPLHQRALAIRMKVLGPDHPDTAVSLNNLAEVYVAQGLYDQALSLHQQALGLRERVLGPEHPDTAASLNNLAGLYEARGSYDRALALYRQALEIREKVLGPRHRDTAASLNNLAGIHRAMGTYDQALALYQRALEAKEKSLGPEHPAVAVTLNNLAELYDSLGAPEKALPLFQRAIGIQEKTLGPEHPTTAISLSNLALHYKGLGVYDQALPLYRRVLEIREKALGAEHPDTAQSLNNLAMLYQAMGLTEEALPLHQRTLRIVEKSLGPGHPHTLTGLGNLGFLYLSLNDLTAAEALFKRGRHNFGLVELSLAQGQPKQALKLLQGQPLTWKALPGQRVAYETLQGLALAGAGRRPEAALALLQATRGVEELRRRAPGERTGFFQGGGLYGGLVRPYRGLVGVLGEMACKSELLPPALKAYGPGAGAAAFYFAEATKGRVLLEAMAQAARKAARIEIPAGLREKEESLLQQLTALEGQWEKAFTGGEAALKEVQEKKARLNGELRALIQDLRRQYPLYAALHYPEPFPAADLPLRDNEVLLEYALGEASSYLMVVRQGGVRRIVRIPLGRKEVEARVKAFMEPFIKVDPQGFSISRARKLFELLLAGGWTEIKETDRVIIVPDGILGLLPFEALVIKEGKGLEDSLFVGDRHALSYYQSAGVLALQRRLEEPRAARPLLALGNPVFSPRDARWLAAQTGTTPDPASGEPQEAFRALATQRDWGKTGRGDSQGKELAYAPLPETEAEVKEIAHLLGVAVQPPDVLLNLEANETRLRQSPLGDYRFLHFATHADLSNKVQGLKEPFILLGQVGNQGRDDGFLTLSKVLDLQLRAGLVVLSACQTGRGKVMEGEGVANFARAFQHAGARRVVVSLWPVASQEAVEFMVRFYGHLRDGQTPAAALHQARRAIKAKYPQPFFWAVFILHGEN